MTKLSIALLFLWALVASFSYGAKLGEEKGALIINCHEAFKGK
jgi:hypothetical protein